MASIPLPALHINAYPGPGPLQQYAELAQIQAMRQQQRYQAQAQPIELQRMQQEQQSGAVDLQMKQLALKNSQIGQAAMSDPNFQKDFADWQKNKGATPTTPISNGPSGGITQQGNPESAAEAQERLLASSPEIRGAGPTQFYAGAPTPVIPHGGTGGFRVTQSQQPQVQSQQDANAQVPQTPAPQQVPVAASGGALQLHPLAQYLAEKKGLPMFGPGGALEVSNMLIGSAQKVAELAATQGKAGNEKLDAGKKQLDSFDNIAEPVLSETDPVKQAQALQNLQREVAAHPELYPDGVTQNPSALRDIQSLQQTANSSKVHADLLDHAKKIYEVEAEAGKSNPQSPFYAPSAASIAMGTAPGAAQIQKNERQQAASKAAAEAAATAPIEIQKAVSTEIAKQQALAPELKQISNTTMAGRTYINREDIPKESAGIVEQRAAQQGIPVVDKDTAGTLTDIDDAKANMNTMLGLVKGKLATSPGERIYKGPENKLEAAMQTDPTLASMGTFRNAAIKTMRAVAGSKGLRINQYEVQLAIDNDIPKMTDTWDVAASKIATLQKFLDNAEISHLVRNRAAGQNAGQAHVPGGAAQGLKEGQTGTGSDGKKYIVKGGVWQPQ